MGEEKSIFRKESMDRIASPEQVDDYIHIASPGVWFMLVAVLLLLAGGIAWGFAGRLETKLSVEGVSSGGSAVVVIEKEQADSLQTGSTAYSSGYKGQVVRTDEEGNKLSVTVQIPGMPDGVVEILLVTESVAPISFLV